MKWFIGAVFVTGLVCGLSGAARADGDKDTDAILDKAIKAMGGEEKLKAVKAATWKTKGKINFGGNESDFNSQVTFQGLDHFRQESEGEFNGMKVQFVTVLGGDKAWRKFGEMAMDLDKDAVANEKRNVYLQIVPVTLLPLKGKEFKLKAAGEEKVGDRPAVALAVTGPEGKDFKLYFDKESGLPVKLAAKIIGFGGDEVAQETTFGSYKEFNGVKKATKVETKRGGNRFLDSEITEFKVLDKVDPKTFTEPK
jgi:hypothetical protein